MDIWPDPRGLCIFIHICLHSWMGNKFLYCIIVCYKSHTLFSSSPASSGISLEKQGNLSKKICHEVKMTPGKRLKSGMLTDHVNESNYAKSFPWKQVRIDDGKSLDSMLMNRCRLPLFLFISDKLPHWASPTHLLRVAGSPFVVHSEHDCDYIARLP